MFREVASGAKTDRGQLRKVLAALDAGEVLMVTRLDRLARSTRDLLNTLATITAKKAGFRSLGDTWADTTTSHGRLMLTVQQELAAEKTKEEDKKRAHRHYADAVLILSKLYAMSGASDAAREIRDEVGFFQAVRVALIKTIGGGGRSAADRELAIQQIVSRAVVSTEIVDIMAAIGLGRPDISILSDDFLAEVRDLDKKNLAIEALRKLLNGQVHSQGKRNVTQARAFSERLEAAISRYHSNAVTTVEVLEELSKLAQEIRAARERGEESGLTEDEIAFYDALAVNQSARDVMGEPALRVIAHELVQSIRSNVTVDWAHREAARARLRSLVKRILRKYGYPPDLQDAAVQNVLQQAEALSAELA